MYELTAPSKTMWCIVHSPFCAAVVRPHEFSNSCSTGRVFSDVVVRSAGHASSFDHRRISHWHIKMQTDSHQGTATVNVTEGFVDREREIRLNHCWFVCRAAERSMTISIQTPKTGVLSAALTTATPACKWSMPPIFTWSRSLMTRWAHKRTRTQALHTKGERRDFKVITKTFLLCVPVWQGDWQHMGGEGKAWPVCLVLKKILLRKCTPNHNRN